MTTSESKGRFFYKTNRFESIRMTNLIESIRIANWNALVCIIISNHNISAVVAVHECQEFDVVGIGLMSL